jgi:hypothetical protein
MVDRTITLRADLVEQLEALAEKQGRTLDEVFGDLLGNYAPSTDTNWATALADGMTNADIPWIDDPDASVNSRRDFEEYLEAKRRETNNPE